MVWTKKAFSLVVVFLGLFYGAPLLGNPDSGISLTGTKETGDRTTFPYLEIKQDLTTQTTLHGQRVGVELGDVVTLTVTVTNVGSAVGTSSCRIYLPKGLSYIPDTFFVDGVPTAPNFIDVQLVCPVSVPAYHEPGWIATLSLQARVDAFPDDATTLIPTSMWTSKGPSFVLYGGYSPPVLIVLKDASVPYAMLDLAETVRTEAGHNALRADIQPNETLTLTMTVTNLGDLPAEHAQFKTGLPSNLHYITGSFLVNGRPQVPSTQTTDWNGLEIAWNFDSIPAYGQSDGPITLSFQVQADATLFGQDDYFSHDSSISVNDKAGQPVSTNSNQIILMWQK